MRAIVLLVVLALTACGGSGSETELAQTASLAAPTSLESPTPPAPPVETAATKPDATLASTAAPATATGVKPPSAKPPPVKKPRRVYSVTEVTVPRAGSGDAYSLTWRGYRVHRLLDLVSPQDPLYADVDFNSASVNAAGDAAGLLMRRSTATPHAFVLHDGRLTLIGPAFFFDPHTGTLQGSRDNAVFLSDINAYGDVTGNWHDPDGAVLHANNAFIRWADGTTTHLPTLGGSQVGASRINNRGQVIGRSTVLITNPDGSTSERPHAFLWSHGKLIDLHDKLPRVTPSPTLPEFEYPMPFALNNHGHVSGGSSVGGRDEPDGSHAFVFKGSFRYWDSVSFRKLTDPRARWNIVGPWTGGDSQASHIFDDGRVVIDSFILTSGEEEGRERVGHFMFDGKSTRRVQSFVDPADPLYAALQVDWRLRVLDAHAASGNLLVRVCTEPQQPCRFFALTWRP